jgi:hypothetical protein
MTDKRVLPRATLRSLATVTSDAGVVECRIVNLSTSGMAFESFEELPCQIISKIQTYVRKKSLDELA